MSIYKGYDKGKEVKEKPLVRMVNIILFTSLYALCSFAVCIFAKVIFDGSGAANFSEFIHGYAEYVQEKGLFALIKNPAGAVMFLVVIPLIFLTISFFYWCMRDFKMAITCLWVILTLMISYVTSTDGIGMFLAGTFCCLCSYYCYDAFLYKNKTQG